ncbi:hypothetical protein M446_4962 [Methylobacterium sp. 4-46]|uniref:hypothetical protein n=1 Tax=unclassified Methylobacterium TaxID=2615210 RepID=UPI000165CB5D|nr:MULTISPECIES: hypothetical protein [Methylobacterium]ACA19290.1 hypothetical protein M446_4962 [Methylobacterium sp. 4-46]WFT78493.1 hypothetical protein QA634_24940 [Methylobacterium nodulans]
MLSVGDVIVTAAPKPADNDNAFRATNRLRDLCAGLTLLIAASGIGLFAVHLEAVYGLR